MTLDDQVWEAEFAHWEEVLRTPGWHASRYTDPLLSRWQQAALEARAKHHLFPEPSLDLAVLTRQVLRRTSEVKRKSADLLIPRGGFWPSETQWQSCGVLVHSATEQFFRIEASLWTPSYGGGKDPSAAAVAEWRRREQNSLPADPLFTRYTGFDTCSSPGQQQALRAVWYAPQGVTIAAILPTGSGKSSVAQVPALSYAQGGRLSVMVVPTVALALDQERALLEMAQKCRVSLPKQLAVHRGLSRQDRAALISRIRQGQQGMLITSPESLVGGLSGLLFEVAEHGQLALLAIDEAHLAVQWGRDFRPEFQILAGLRRSLLEACPPERRFTTLLLTATVTESDLMTLRQLFSEPGHFELIAGVKLRAEPDYWAAHFNSWPERNTALEEAVRHLPRPMIVYTTAVRDAETVFERFRTMGFRRLGLLTGASTAAEREQVVAKWQQDRLDLVVGTSAFGVGIDQAHVRAVVHACVPENADRYYQEVGRGGRDGRASLALSLTCPNDWDTARSMSIPTLVTTEVGLERWRQMFTRKVRQVGLGMVDVDLRSHQAGIIYDSDKSREWNRYTLNLMARAGLVRLHQAPLPYLDPTVLSEEEIKTELEVAQWIQRVELLNDRHLDRLTWEEVVEPLRLQEMSTAGRSLQALEALLKGTEEAGDVLSREYTVNKDLFIHPEWACGGCAVCRAAGDEPTAGLDPIPSVAFWSPVEVERWLAGPGLKVKVVHNQTELLSAAERAVLGGVRVLMDPAGVLQTQYAHLQALIHEPLLIEQDTELLFAPPLPRLLVADPDSDFIPGEWSQTTSTLLLCWTHQEQFGHGDRLLGNPDVHYL